MGIYAVPSALASHNRGTAIPACPVAVWPNQPQSSRKWSETFGLWAALREKPRNVCRFGFSCQRWFRCLRDLAKNRYLGSPVFLRLRLQGVTGLWIRNGTFTWESDG